MTIHAGSCEINVDRALATALAALPPIRDTLALLSVERDARTLVGGQVVGDHVVLHDVREVARHQEPQAATVVVRQVGLQEVVVHVDCTAALRTR